MNLANTNTISAGLVKDTSPLVQKDGTYPYALNAVLESTDGDFPFITNELGNALQVALPGVNPILLGSVLTDTETFICTVVTSTSSIIGEYFPRTKTFTILISSPDLSFNSHYPIKMLFRIRKGCVRTIYFTDDLNPYRVMDVDNVLQYGTPFEADNLNLSKKITVPSLTVDSVQDFGGSTEVGNYQYAIQYLDTDLNETPWLNFTPFHPITNEPLSSSYYEVDGGYNIATPGVAGVGEVAITTKSVVLRVDNLDSNFTFFRIAVITATSGTGEVSGTYLLTPQAITGPSQTFVFRGVDSSNATQTELGEVLNNNLPIYKAGSHAQIDNRLYLGNLSNKVYDWARVQRSANENIVVKWFGQPVLKNDLNTSGIPKSPYYYTKTKSFLRDEVYPLTIYGKLNDGTRTPAFHIPGTESIPSDLDNITVIADGTPRGVDEINLADVKHLGFVNLGDDIGYGVNIVPRWLVFNTATNDRMAYWESDVNYPEDVDCNGDRIYPVGKIRHHKFPNNELIPIEDEDNIYPIGINVDITNFVLNLPSEVTIDVVEWVIARGERDDTNRTIFDKGYLITSQVIGDTSGQAHIEGDRVGNYFFTPLPGWSPVTYDRRIHFYCSPLQMVKRPSLNMSYITSEAQFLTEFNEIPSFSVKKIFIDWNTHLDNNTLFNRTTAGYRHIDR
jgi:hypothetical protein